MVNGVRVTSKSEVKGSGRKFTCTCRDQVCPLASTPVKPKVRTIGAGRLYSTTSTFTVVEAGMFRDGKYFASGCGSPSIVKPVTMAGTPAASRRLIVVCQTSPSALRTGQVAFGAVGTIAAAPAGTVTWMVRVAPPPLNAASPE